MNAPQNDHRSKALPRDAHEMTESLNPNLLERVAREATPGPWVAVAPSPSGRFLALIPQVDVNGVLVNRWMTLGKTDYEFIATFNPERVLSLLSLLSALSAAEEALTDAGISDVDTGTGAPVGVDERIDLLAARTFAAEEERDDYRERLHDLVMVDAEEWATGGGPGFKERRDKAWTRAREPFEP